MNNRTVSQNIKELIEYVGLNQAQLAKITGITPAAISMYVNGERTPTIENLEKIADACDTGVEYILRKSDDKTPPPMDISKLNKEDQEEVLKFMEFLRHKGKTK